MASSSNSTAHAIPEQHKKDKKRKKATTGAITNEEYEELKSGFDLIIAFFHRYAEHHNLSEHFVHAIKEYGPILSQDLDEGMQQFQYSQSQFLLFLRGREQTLRTMETICMERFGAALKNVYQVRQTHDLVLAIESQQKYKIESLKKHATYASHIHDQLDRSVVTFAVTADPPHDHEAIGMEQMKRMTKERVEDRECRLALESVALRGLRQLLKITTRNEEQVKNWKPHHNSPTH